MSFNRSVGYFMLSKRLCRLLCWLIALSIYVSSFPALAAPKTRATSKLTTSQIAQSAGRSVVKITVRDVNGQVASTGSGFIVAPNRIATSWHVVNSAWSATANYRDGESLPIDGLVTVDKSRDIAILATATGRRRPLLLGDTSTIQSGDKAVALGAPYGLSGTVSDGVISAIRRLPSVCLLQITAATSPGSSGGPVLDARGRVVGVTSFQFTSGQNLNFAVSSGHIKPLLRLLGQEPDTFPLPGKGHSIVAEEPDSGVPEITLPTGKSTVIIESLQNEIVELLGVFGRVKLDYEGDARTTNSNSVVFPEDCVISVVASHLSIGLGQFDGNHQYTMTAMLSNLDARRVSLEAWGDTGWLVKCPVIGDAAIVTVSHTISIGGNESPRPTYTIKWVSLTVNDQQAAIKLRRLMIELISACGAK